MEQFDFAEEIDRYFMKKTKKADQKKESVLSQKEKLLYMRNVKECSIDEIVDFLKISQKIRISRQTLINWIPELRCKPQNKIQNKIEKIMNLYRKLNFDEKKRFFEEIQKDEPELLENFINREFPIEFR